MERMDDLLALSKSEDIFIEIGTKVYLEIEGVTFPVSSVFIGLLKDEFMIITPPRKFRSVKNKLFPANSMVVKYLFDGSVYAFQTSLIEMITTPVQAMVLEYPRVIQQRELRGSKRRNVVIPGRVEARTRNFPVMINDISKKGCRFVYQEKKLISEGDRIEIFCKFPGYEREANVTAIVRNTSREQGVLYIGAEFEDASQEFLVPLVHFLISIEGFSV